MLQSPQLLTVSVIMRQLDNPTASLLHYCCTDAALCRPAVHMYMAICRSISALLADVSRHILHCVNLANGQQPGLSRITLLKAFFWFSCSFEQNSHYAMNCLVQHACKAQQHSGQQAWTRLYSMTIVAHANITCW